MAKISLKNLRFSKKCNLAENKAAAAEQEFLQCGAFSADGFIEEQNRLGFLRCGARPADYCGCGFIAAYNLLHIVKRPAEIPELISEFEHGLVLGGVFGTSPIFMLRFLRKNFAFAKLFLKKSSFLKSNPQKGVIFYMRRDFSAHYVAFSREKDGAFRFYNYRETGFCQCMEDFFREKNRRLFLMYSVE